MSLDKNRVIVCSHDQTSDFRVLKKHNIQPNALGQILWHIVNFTPDMDRYKTILAFTQAFDSWQVAMDAIPPVGRVIQFKSTDNYEEAHIRLMFLDPKKKEHIITRSDGSTMKFIHEWPFDGNGGILAHVPFNCEDIYFDEGENWGEMFKWVGDDLFAPLMETCEHEIGHSLDLDHTQSESDCMYPKSDGTRRHVSQDSIDGMIKTGWGEKKKKFSTSNAVAVTGRNVGEEMIFHALKLYGLKEVPGPGNQKDIIAMIKGMFPDAKDDGAVAWCSVFMNYIAQLAGIKGTGSGMARSWLKWGVPVKWEDRRPGDVAVYWRGTPNGPSGHVHLYVNDAGVEGAYLRGLGGNQSDGINIAAYAKERLLELRRYE